MNGSSLSRNVTTRVIRNRETTGRKQDLADVEWLEAGNRE